MLLFQANLLLLIILHVATTCIGQEIVSKVNDCFLEHSVERKTPRPLIDRRNDFNYTHSQRHIVAKNAIDKYDIQQIHALTNCIRVLAPSHFEYRPFDLGVEKYGGGNNVTYVGGYFQRIMPAFVNHIIEVVSTATEHSGWRPHPKHLGIRCIETLDYGIGGELLWHVDFDSIYTVVLMLSDKSDFVGGNFVIRDKKKARDPKTGRFPTFHVELEKGSALVFDSNSDHGVETVEVGLRSVLVFELWMYEDTGPFEFRSPPEPYATRQIKPSILTLPVFNEDSKQARLVSKSDVGSDHDCLVRGGHGASAFYGLLAGLGYGFALAAGVTFCLVKLWTNPLDSVDSVAKDK